MTTLFSRARCAVSGEARHTVEDVGSLLNVGRTCLASSIGARGPCGALGMRKLNQQERWNARSNELTSATINAPDNAPDCIGLEQIFRAVVFTGVGRALSARKDFAAFQCHMPAREAP